MFQRVGKSVFNYALYTMSVNGNSFALTSLGKRVEKWLKKKIIIIKKQRKKTTRVNSVFSPRFLGVLFLQARVTFFVRASAVTMTFNGERVFRSNINRRGLL